MERRQLADIIVNHHVCFIEKYVGEPPTLHKIRLQPENKIPQLKKRLQNLLSGSLKTIIATA
ncbi:hypothetical protein [Kingella negevensis]|uniref:hypothetical protein n=1 Tax=Kingella negevensis TaxID=1522312 RepID=UPI00050A2E99|nr:hypothetical protein [Kingella negevensis]WII91645.1 hypothetical protein QEO93_03430 [Kingella negevensis]